MQVNDLQKKWLVRFSLLFLGVIAFTIFFYIAFPFHLVQNEMVHVFEAKTGCKANPEDQTVLFPLRFQWHDLEVNCPKTDPFMLEWLKADVAILPALFKQQGEVFVKIKIAQQQGEIAGLIVMKKEQKGIAYSLRNATADLQINHQGFSGILSFKGSGNWVGEKVSQGAGAFNFNLKNAQIKDQAWAWPIENIVFEKVVGKGSWQRGILSIKDFYAEGEHATLKSTKGEVVLRDPALASRIDVTLHVFPKGPLQQVAVLLIPNYSVNDPLTLSITGGFPVPNVSLNGRVLSSAS